MSTMRSPVRIEVLDLSESYLKLQPYVGNDNAEFGTSSSGEAYVDTDMVINYNLAFSEPDNAISLQYNPDYDASKSQQYSGYWFQAGVIATSSSCFEFTVQIYNLNNGNFVWGSWLPSATSCYSISGGLNSGAVWFINENEANNNNHITSVFFEIYVNGGRTTGTINPPNSNYIWIKSNLCLCGVDYHSATFSSAGGTLNYVSNVNLNQIGPPTDIATAENSNLNYLYMSGSGTTSMSQTFDLSPHC